MVKINATNTEDQALLEKLIKADRKAIRQVYDLVLPSVIYWVKENQGTEEDARDLFQEAMIALYRKLEQPEFALSCRLKSFLRIICRNLWLTRLRDNKKFQASPLENCEAYELKDDTLEQLERSEEEQLYFYYFDQLGEPCKKILQWFFAKVSLAEIAKKLDTTQQYIKKRKYVCKEKLVSKIKEDPKYRELMSAK
jgi:RNA polymerase sigma factor (sigma-70 family)